MILDFVRRMSARLGYALSAALASVILVSCGGGGASHDQPVANLQLLPSAATLYAGVGYTFTIAGGQPPYTLSSSEPVLLPVPQTLNGNTFVVVPNNPSVIDAGLPPGALPIRSVVITVRDSLGTSISTASTNGITVAQNFLVGSGVSVTRHCASGSQACAGGDTIVRVEATTNGLILANKTLRFDVLRGQFQFVVPEQPSNQPVQLVNSYTTVTDTKGFAEARIRVPLDAQTQLGTLRITDVATGAFVDEVFTITANAITGVLQVIPNDLTFTGPRTGVCGTGVAQVEVFDGTPPYSATSSAPSITVSPTVTGSNPAFFQIQAINPNVCVDATVVITDASNRRGTVTVHTVAGTGSPPALVVSPTTVTLNDQCGFTTSVVAIGGVGPLSVNSTHPRVTAFLSGNTVQITRIASGDGATVYPNSATVSVTDGATVQNVTVNGVAINCP